MSASQSVTPANLPPGMQAEVEREVLAILASPAFHGSRRCSDFLQFIVLRKLQGRADELKERTIASEVFERDAQYDPKTDGVVRVRANEVRKRLAQYYQAAGPGVRLRIELPAGTYVPSFEWVDAPVVHPAVEARPRRWWWAAAAVVAVAGAVLVWGAIPSGAPRELADFWAPMAGSSKPVMICFQTSPVARLMDVGGITPLLPAHPDRRRYEFPIDSKVKLGNSLIYEVDGQLAIGDALAAAAVARSLGELHRPTVMRAGAEVSFLDIKGNPSVLIGAFNNRWALEVTSGLRFQFGRPTHILDTATGQKWSIQEENGRATEDYALVSRLITSRTGGAVMAIGGLKHAGTQAAGEFVSDVEALRRAGRSLPSGWERRNLQVVVKTVLTQERPGPPEVVAVHSW